MIDMAEVLYFASLREKLGSSREQLPLPDAITVAQLKSLLAGKDNPKVVLKLNKKRG